MERLRSFLLWLLVSLGFMPKPDFVARLVDDHPTPDSMEPGILYIVGNREFQKWAYMLCPSKLDEVIQLSLQTKRRPHWLVRTDFFGRPSVHPSIWQLEGSYAHFWVRRGKIEWALGSGKKPNFVPNFEDEA